MNKNLAIFCDFDGTITKRDVIITIMEKFAPPEWVQIKDDILYNRTIPLKTGIEMLFRLIDSNKKEAIESYIKETVQTRDGFEELLIYCNENNIKFHVVSGGLGFHIYPILEKYINNGLLNKKNIICNEADFTAEKIKVSYKYLPKNCTLCGDCGCCKIEFLENYPDSYKIVIGDSLTDLSPSKIADMVFARGDLIKYLNEEKINYVPFETFFEIQSKLQTHEETKTSQN